MRKVAFITGINGQDGSYLAEYLIGLGYEVHGMVRRNSTAENQDSRIIHLSDSLTTHYGDLTDEGSIDRILTEVNPTEIYNIGAQSHVRISFDMPQFTVKTNSLGVLNMLESYRRICPNARFYQASSSEMFGDSVDLDGYQRETTPMHPVSPYGCAKLFGYSIVRNYRKAYNLHAVNGILFNHESPRRGSNFVTNKVVKTAIEIKFGLKKTLELGNLDSYRDWGHSKDYVRAMHMIMQHNQPDDFVVSMGQTKSVRDMCEYVFTKIGLNYQDHVIQNKKYLRPQELPYLKGDSTKIRSVLGWTPTYTFESMMDEMIDFWNKKIKHEI